MYILNNNYIVSLVFHIMERRGLHLLENQYKENHIFHIQFQLLVQVDKLLYLLMMVIICIIKYIGSMV